jgi:UDP-GlcNAc:undecaprenyl-phosphate/decaprenyl-phosphate GlcNAc-1-phosphate transferase
VVSALVAFVAALVVAILLTPLVRRFARELGVLDHPGERRVHALAIPRLGGIAITAAFFVPLLALFSLETAVAQVFFAHPMRTLGLALGGLLVCGIGIIDDVRGVRAWHKLCVQVAAACIAYVCGYRIDAVALPFLGHLPMGIFALPITVLWITAIINAINLIDGLDGLAGGVAFFACVTNFVVGVINRDPIVMLMSASLGGALLGFLLYNFNPASIFMGDSGSLFLGYVLATMSILGNSVKSSTTVAILVPFIAMGLPIIDTLFAMLRRFLERRPIFSPDQGHIHHRLLALGLTHRRAVLILYGLSVVFTGGAIALALGRNWQVGVALLILSVAVIGLLRAMGTLQVALGRIARRQSSTGASSELRRTVPQALLLIHAAKSAEELSAILRDFGDRSKLVAIEVRDAMTPGALQGFLWQRAASPDDLPEAVVSTHPLPAAGPQATFVVSWPTENGELGTEGETLLQLIADACDARVARFGESTRPSREDLQSYS